MAFFKKGQTFIDLATLIFFAFVIAISVVVGYLLVSNLNTEIQADADISAEAKAASTTITTHYPNLFDKIFLLFLILFWGFLIISSFLIDSHPVFFIVSVILLLFIFVVGMSLANAYEEVSEDDDLQTYADAFPIMNWVMGNFLIIIIVMGFTTATALYAKNRI